MLVGKLAISQQRAQGRGSWEVTFISSLKRKSKSMDNSDSGILSERLRLLRGTAASSGNDPSTSREDAIAVLASVSERLTAEMETRRKEFARVSEDMRAVRADVENIKQTVNTLCKLVRDGNGQPSLLQRLATTESVVSTNKEDIEEVRTHANTIIAAKALSKSQVIAGLAGMIVTALISGLALIATLMK